MNSNTKNKMIGIGKAIAESVFAGKEYVGKGKWREADSGYYILDDYKGDVFFNEEKEEIFINVFSFTCSFTEKEMNSDMIRSLWMSNERGARTNKHQKGC